MYKTLHNGVQMPIIGFGTHKILDEDVEEIVYNAIKVGYRHIDTASVYNNEAGIGRAIKRCIQEGIVKREDLFITTKTPWKRPGYNETLEGFEESLQKLGLDYIDLYLIHHPFGNFFNQEYYLSQTARAVEYIYKSGKARAWGVSNFMEQDLIYLRMETSTYPMVNQVEVHPLYRNERIRAYCKERNIVTISWAPLHQGHINKLDDVFSELSKKYNKSIAQIMLRWNLQNDCAFIVRSSKTERMIENRDIEDFELQKEDVAKLSILPEYTPWFREDRYKPLGTIEREVFFNRISALLKLPKTNDIIYYRLFNVFPILKKKYKKNEVKYYLFGFIPFLYIQNK